MSIEKLEDEISNKINSQQYLQSSYIIIKELIENSIDAKASEINVRLNNSEIIIDDNGCGIKDLDLLGNEGCTSKHDFNDNFKIANGISNPCTLGFRGQALFSIKNVSRMQVITRTKEESVARSFYINEKTIKKCARDYGTTFIIKDVFYNSEIRKREYENNLKKDIQKILILIKSYCLVYNLKISVNYNKKTYTEVGSSSILESLKKNFFEYFNDECFLNVDNEKYNLYFSRKGHKDRTLQFFFGYRRPISHPTIAKTVNFVFKKFDKLFPVFVLQFKQVEDVNLSVEKNVVIIKNEREIILDISSKIERFLSETCMPFLTIKCRKNTKFVNNALLNKSIKSCFEKNNDQTKENILIGKKEYNDIANINASKNPIYNHCFRNKVNNAITEKSDKEKTSENFKNKSNLPCSPVKEKQSEKNIFEKHLDIFDKKSERNKMFNILNMDISDRKNRKINFIKSIKDPETELTGTKSMSSTKLIEYLTCLNSDTSKKNFDSRFLCTKTHSLLNGRNFNNFETSAGEKRIISKKLEGNKDSETYSNEKNIKNFGNNEKSVKIKGDLENSNTLIFISEFSDTKNDTQYIFKSTNMNEKNAMKSDLKIQNEKISNNFTNDSKIKRYFHPTEFDISNELYDRKIVDLCNNHNFNIGDFFDKPKLNSDRKTENESILVLNTNILNNDTIISEKKLNFTQKSKNINPNNNNINYKSDEENLKKYHNPANQISIDSIEKVKGNTKAIKDLIFFKEENVNNITDEIQLFKNIAMNPILISDSNKIHEKTLKKNYEDENYLNKHKVNTEMAHNMPHIAKKIPQNDKTQLPCEYIDQDTIYDNNLFLDNNFKGSINTDNDENYEFKIVENTLFEAISVKKSDLGNLNIIGQFNHGFILSKLVNFEKELLIIVDQHAADEIATYETLENDFYLKKQRLIVPLPINLTLADEIFINSNIQILRRNGFDLDENYNLTYVPIYKNNIFTAEDFWDLVEEIKIAPIYDKKYIFCKKIKEIMASKACRSSKMIGQHLTHIDMEKIIKKLSTLRHPWKCPHGRPVFKILMSKIINKNQ
ncbi:DNA mismatch repair protein MutL [Edhazardia aedis USNM 41457]|uniref:DNA mismatch repair protein MutL n=1 Tax=Edhazardia aedis (strain USNM 41457) TaxID=1003232 RepID=J9DRA6_EDHAE|nr:DNA mismatch repair protein MutL [Edhazardia aedis USNM 41457]|eukprot:EJW03872.1 DNA mismatch repair protein MutL [Edhazardia aedis USNM 41457]